MNEADFIWMNDEIVPWNEAKIHVLTHGLHYGTGVFEGERAYETDRGTAVFRHTEHLQRLHQSGEMYHMEIPYSVEQLREATHEVIKANKLSSCYIRPIAFRGYGEMGLSPLNSPVDVAIAVWPWGAYLGEEGQKTGIRARVSSWRRMSGASFIPQAKATGQYLNSVLAKVESHFTGYEEAIMLDEHGNVSEGSGENVFVVRDGRIFTPPTRTSILDGITARSVCQIAADLGFAVEHRDIARGELYTADEVFLTGTAAEMVPVREIDDQRIGPPGELTQAIQKVFFEALHGKRDEYLEWLDFVEPRVESAAPAADESQEASASA